jgi:FAD/FMN-containing dehydrogenase
VPQIESLLGRLARVVGPTNVITDPDLAKPYVIERRGRYTSLPQAIIRPASTAQVVEIMMLCHQAGVRIVPQGGNTGLTGATVAAPGEIIMQLGRMNRIRSLDARNFSVEVEAGVVLADLQRAAAEQGCHFPLSLAAEGSCQIGGNISTNAGGVSVLHYGNARELVLGLEVVLSDGRVWNGMRKLRKNNTGYDLKHLFIGAEGTLGIITAAMLRLFPAHVRQATAWVGLSNVDDALRLLAKLEDRYSGELTALELVPRVALDMVRGRWPDLIDPIAAIYPYYALVELTSPAPGADLRDGLGDLLAEMAEDGCVRDGVLAHNAEQTKTLWSLRERISEAQGYFGGSIKHDISVPRSRIPAFMRAAADAVGRAMPGVVIVAFGHLGDGNLHYNLSQPVGMDRADFLNRWEEMNRVVHDLVVLHGGSIAAEHGIGLARRDELARYTASVELDMMRALRSAVDPDGLLNPGKVIDLPSR